MFLCRDLFEVQWFSTFAAGVVDVWAVDGVAETDLVQAPGGYVYLPRPVPRSALTRIELPVTS